jgi:AAA+ superfamily predicted ATPase
VTINQFKKVFNKNLDGFLIAIEDQRKREGIDDISSEKILFIPFNNIYELVKNFSKRPYSLSEEKNFHKIQDIFPNGCHFYKDITLEAYDIDETVNCLNNPFVADWLNQYDLRNKTSYFDSLKELLYEFVCLIVDSLESKNEDQIQFPEFYKNSPFSSNSSNSNQKKQIKQIKRNSKDIDESIGQIYKLVGLDPVKKEIQNLINLIRVNQLRLERGIGSVSPFSHLVFTGNPGTGKTTVARLLGDIYAGLGLLDSGHLVETDRSGLVAGYVGQTAIKVADVFKSALGGVLFIDEAYSLFDNGTSGYGQEAIDTLMKLIEDNRGKILVIVAGYPDKMDEFLNSNPGMKSRFNKTILFPDYSINELLEVLRKLATNSGFTFSEDAFQKSLSLLSENADENGFLPGNARFVRNLFHEIISNQANRIVNESNLNDDALQRIEASDISF